ncbi:MAG: hypothetical protein CMM47_04190 [Rhodospirillaceae bacterium]|nr:hypothetical protein [Rhodospirillaceae bacterium]
MVSEIRDADLDELIETIRDQGVESVAVCFLFSFLNPSHEERVGRALRDAMPTLEVVLSSEILREFREYRPTSTTVFAAISGA